MKKHLLFAGLDVHAQNITVALAPGDTTEARLYGTIPNDLHALERVFARLRKAHPGAELRVCGCVFDDRQRAEPCCRGF